MILYMTVSFFFPNGGAEEPSVLGGSHQDSLPPCSEAVRCARVRKHVRITRPASVKATSSSRAKLARRGPLPCGPYPRPPSRAEASATPQAHGPVIWSR
jgi:hypothetical protein